MTTPTPSYPQGDAIAYWKGRAETAERELAAAKERAEANARALAEIREEWAGAECGEPVTAQEAYAIGLCKRMYGIAVAAIDAAMKEKP